MPAIAASSHCQRRAGVCDASVFAGLVARSLAGVEIGHRQPYHEELLIVVEGEAEFRVGDETRHVNPGDFVFMPRDTIHGTVATRLEPLSFLSIITPRIDLTKDLIWENEPPRFRMV